MGGGDVVMSAFLGPGGRMKNVSIHTAQTYHMIIKIKK